MNSRNSSAERGAPRLLRRPTGSTCLRPAVAVGALLLAGLLLAPPTFAMPTALAGGAAADLDEGAPLRGAAPGEVLFDSIQFHIGGAFSVSSQSFTGVTIPDGRTAATFSGDDFTVDGFGWVIDQVEVKGNYFSGTGPADSVNIYVLEDAGGLPATIDVLGSALVMFEGLPFIDNTPAAGDLVIPLPTSLQLAPGTYWLVVQANMAFPNQWGWTTIETTPGSGDPVGGLGVFLQNATVVDAGCIETWGPVLDTCGIETGGARDFGFLLRGTPAEPPVLAVPTLSYAALGLLALLLSGAGFAILRR